MRLIGGKDDVRAALAAVNGQALTRGTTALLPHAVQPATDTTPDSVQLLPAHPDLASLLAWGGLRRGTTVAATGCTSLLMLLLAGAMHDTAAWAAIVGLPAIGLLAACQDYRIPADRLAVIPDPGPDWASIAATVVDGVDLAVINPPADTPPGIVRSLQARARKTGCVLIPTQPWPGADIALDGRIASWHGLRQGRGRLRHADLEITVTGRGKAYRPRTVTVTVPPGAQRQPAAFPPPLFVKASDHRPGNPLWQQVVPSPPPADPWTVPSAAPRVVPSAARLLRSSTGAGNHEVMTASEPPQPAPISARQTTSVGDLDQQNPGVERGATPRAGACVQKQAGSGPVRHHQSDSPPTPVGPVESHPWDARSTGPTL